MVIHNGELHRCSVSGVFQRCVSPEEGLLVGDSAYDGQGAQSLPMDFVAALYGWGFRKKEETLPYHPMGLLEQPRDLLKLLA